MMPINTRYAAGSTYHCSPVLHWISYHHRSEVSVLAESSRREVL